MECVFGTISSVYGVSGCFSRFSLWSVSLLHYVQSMECVFAAIGSVYGVSVCCSRFSLWSVSLLQ